MFQPDPAELAARAANMTDEELMDSWQTASDEERRHPSAFLQAIVDEMNRRRIPL